MILLTPEAIAGGHASSPGLPVAMRTWAISRRPVDSSTANSAIHA
jgi:hypothetical protein